MFVTFYSLPAIHSSPMWALGPDPSGGFSDVWRATRRTFRFPGTAPMTIIKETTCPIVFQNRRALPWRVSNDASGRWSQDAFVTISVCSFKRKRRGSSITDQRTTYRIASAACSCFCMVLTFNSKNARVINGHCCWLWPLVVFHYDDTFVVNRHSIVNGSRDGETFYCNTKISLACVVRLLDNHHCDVSTIKMTSKLSNNLYFKVQCAIGKRTANTDKNDLPG